jgi:hypothetical protein
MGTVLIIICWIGAIACSTHFWFSYARARSGQPAPIKRMMTIAVFMGWPIYLGYQVLQRQSISSGTHANSDAEKRILG